MYEVLIKYEVRTKTTVMSRPTEGLVTVGISKCLWKFHFSIDKNYPYHFSYAQSCLSKYEGVVWWLKCRIRVRHNLKYTFRKWRNVVSSDSYKLRFRYLQLVFSHIKSSCNWIKFLKKEIQSICYLLVFSTHIPTVRKQWTRQINGGSKPRLFYPTNILILTTYNLLAFWPISTNFSKLLSLRN